MNGLTLTQLKILVERCVRPVQASTSYKRKVREELLAHVTTVFEEELARLADEQAALQRTEQRFGNPVALTGQLQESVPTLDFVERFADWVSFRPWESTLRRAVRYTILVEVVALLFLFTASIIGGKMSHLPTGALSSYTDCVLLSTDFLRCTLRIQYPPAATAVGCVLLSIGYLGFTIGILESSIRRLLGEQTSRSWLQLALVLVGSTIVSMTLGLWAFGVSPKNTFWVAGFTVGLPVVSAWALANVFAARKRRDEEWASLRIE